MEKFKNLGEYLLGLTFLLLIILVVTIFITGGVWLIRILYPILSVIGPIALAVNIFILLPLSTFKKTRMIAFHGLYISSFIFGIITWIFSFLMTYALWGSTGVIIGIFLLGVGVVPIGMLALLLNGAWAGLFNIILGLIFTYGLRVYAIKIAEKIDMEN